MIKLVSLILFSLPSFLLAQQPKAFTIIGHSVFYNNKQLAIQGGEYWTINKYNDFNFVNDKADTVNNPYKLVQVLNNQFTINGFLKYPHPFQISYYDAENNSGRSSDFFFVDGGTINIDISDLSSNKISGNLLQSISNKEYQHLKKLYSNSVDTLTEEIYDFKAKQKTIRKYIIQNPNSYVALWDMVIDYAINKTANKEDDIKSILKNAQLLSSAIKKTQTYQTLIKNITHDLEIATNKIFPNIPLDSLEVVEEKIFPSIPLNSIDSLNPIIKKNKFTLLDFWFSTCMPCIKQFPSFKNTYDLNKSKGFEIIGISVDRNKSTWQESIHKHDLNWLQYLDSYKIITQKLNISSFPTNYLLDNNGKIIKKNISPEDLATFLQKNINSQLINGTK